MYNESEVGAPAASVSELPRHCQDIAKLSEKVFAFLPHHLFYRLPSCDQFLWASPMDRLK